MTLLAILHFAGGVGLFLLGMKLMTDGLRVAAGDALRRLLARWTASLARGIAAGLLITAVVQSSSAVVFATIGFVNAGLLTLGQAVGVIYGSSLGTTVTSWLVAVVGLQFDLKALALPLVAAGMLLRVSGGATRRGALGEALAGFGVFFLGLDVLTDAFSGEAVGFAQLRGDGPAGLLLFAAVGVLLTVAMQSSSAALAVTLTAAAGGLITLEAAAAVIVGSNVGTTSTAAFAVMGATPNAKRAASAQIFFNGLSGALALLLLPLLLALARTVGDGLGVQDAPAVSLAIFHSLMNAMGLLLLWPLTPTLLRFLETRFRTGEEDAARPRHLDGNVLATPALALDALALELGRIGHSAVGAGRAVLSGERGTARADRERQVVDALTMAAADFISKAQRGTLPPDLSEAFPQGLRVTQYFSDMVERAAAVGALQELLTPLTDATLAAALAQFKAEAAQLLEASDPQAAGFSPAASAEAFAALQKRYQELKAELLRAGAEGRLAVRQMVWRLDEIGALRRMLDQAVKAARYLENLRVRPADDETLSDPDAGPEG